MRLGVIVKKDGMICLQAAPNLFYPLTGQSGIAFDFQETFNEPAKHDLGRTLHRVNGILYMGGKEQ